MGSVDDDVCPNAKRRLPRILPVAFFFSALLATCAAILSLSFMPVACGVLLDHTYRAWPPQALQKFRQLIFRWPARARRESIPASAEVHSTSGTRRAFTVGLSQSGFHSRAFTVGLSQSGFGGKGAKEDEWRCGGHGLVAVAATHTLSCSSRHGFGRRRHCSPSPVARTCIP